MRLTHTFALLTTFATLAALPIIGKADVTQADFHESLNLPDFRSGSPRILENLGVSFPSVGPQLTGANEISNPDGWNNGLDVSFDPVTGILSLTADVQNTYQTITVTLDNLTFDNGQIITGITPITLNSAVTPDTASPSLTTAFTSNSFSVNYLTTGFDTFQINDSPATDLFQVQFGSAVPEPGSVALLIGLSVPGVFAISRFKRRRKA